MKPAFLLAGAFATCLASSGAALAQTTLNVATAGDQNMVDYINEYLGPLFEKQNPNVKVRAIGTGAGDAGSQKVFERLEAQSKSGSPTWDVDVAVVHQKIAGKLVSDKLLADYRSAIETGNLVSNANAKSSLGAPVDGYVMPMFNSQTALAYNPDLVPGQPMYYVVPAKAAQADLAKKFIALATSPAVQADGIVKRFSWYPGIDAKHVQAKLDAATWQKLFTDVTPDDLATKGKSFPIGPYFDAILESFERQATANRSFAWGRRHRGGSFSFGSPTS
jgi:ABC-type glycerol-3-phosphate transport system substrate-binding protein